MGTVATQNMLDMKEARGQASVDIRALHDLLWGKPYNLTVLTWWWAELSTGKSEWIVRQRVHDVLSKDLVFDKSCRYVVGHTLRQRIRIYPYIGHSSHAGTCIDALWR